MALPFGSETPALSDEERLTLGALLEDQGFRELAAAYLFAAGLPLSPSIDEKLMLAEQTTEELSHFEAAAVTYADAGLGDLLATVEGRARALPTPASWPEVVIAQFLFDRAGYFQLRDHATATYALYAQMVQKILAEEDHHQAACEATLRELFTTNRHLLAAAQPDVDGWLRIALQSFGRPSTFGGGRAMPWLGGRDSAAVMRDYLQSVATTLGEVGLSLPTRERLGLDLPDDLPLLSAPSPG